MGDHRLLGKVVRIVPDDRQPLRATRRVRLHRVASLVASLEATDDETAEAVVSLYEAVADTLLKSRA